MSLSEESQKLILGAIGDPASALEIIAALNGGSSGANLTLSNLGTTAINAALNPATFNTLSLGTSADMWSVVRANAFRSSATVLSLTGNIVAGSPGTITGLSSTTNLITNMDVSGPNIPIGTTVVSISGTTATLSTTVSSSTSSATVLFSYPLFLATDSQTTLPSGDTFARTGNITTATSSGNLFLITGTAAGTGVTGAITMASGNNSGAGATGSLNIASGSSTSGNSGNVTLSTGTAGASRGVIQLKDGSQGTAGNLWTSTDTNGSGHWAAAPASGANTTLSNLTSPTAINQDLNIISGDASADDIHIQARNSGGGPSFQIAAAAGFAGSSAIIINGNDTSHDNLYIGGNDLNGGGSTSPSVFVASGSQIQLGNSNSSGQASLQSGDATNGATGIVTIKSGNSSAGNSGNILIISGTSSATRGKIQFQDGSQGTAGQIWTSADASGSGSWAAVGVTRGTGTIASATSTATITNAAITTSSIVLVVLTTNDATAAIKNVVPAAGSAAIHLTATTGSTNYSYIVF